MTEFSYPRQNQDVTLAQWGNLARGFGIGILDRGGFPYAITTKDSVTNTVTIGVDTQTGFNSAVIDGFFHFMDAPIAVSVPSVATETVFSIGLRHDPNSTSESGTIKLVVWTGDADYSNGKNYIVLWRIIRKPEVSLANSVVEEVRNRIAPLGVSTKVADLPNTEVGLTDSIYFVREDNNFYRLANNGDGPNTWLKISQGDVVTEAELNTRLGGTANATAFEIGDTVMRRFPDGTARVKPPKEFWDVVNLGTLNSGLAGKASTNHKHSGDDITSGTVPWEAISGSTRAYSNTAHGATWSSVAVDSSGRFWRYGSSTIRIKTNVRDAEYNENILDARLVRYDRIDHPEMTNELGFIAEEMVELVPELVYVDEDGLPNGIQYQEVGMHLVPIVAKQRDEISELKAQLASEKARNDDFESRLAKLENNAD